LIGSDKTAVLIDCITKKVLRQFHNHTAVINSVSMFMLNGIDQVYATASYDATVCLWDARSSNTYRPIQVLKDAKDSVTAVDICSSSNEDDALIRTASVDGIVRTYDIRKGILQCDNYGSPVVSMARSKNNTPSYFSASCLDGTIRVTNETKDWNRNVVTGSATLSTKPIICRDGHVAGRYALECCFLANGTYLLTGSENGSAVLYDVTADRKKIVGTKDELSTCATIAPKIREYIGHTAPTCAVAAHPNNNGVIITASYDGNCIVWANHNNPNEYFK
jgi:mitogen-activated protein kinase organizer 1